jgi:hypothetical protein
MNPYALRRMTFWIGILATGLSFWGIALSGGTVFRFTLAGAVALTLIAIILISKEK